MITDPAILSAIEAVHSGLIAPADISARSVLAAICGVETSWGIRRYAGLFEPSYYRGGRYFSASHVMQAVARYESLASCSYGPWQILFISALELGFDGAPHTLIDPSVSAPLVIKYLNTRTHDPSVPTDFADAWNSGTNRDGIIPYKYLERFMDCYTEATLYYQSAPQTVVSP